MIDSLLNEDKNMDIFIQSNGIELVNNIIKNGILIKRKNQNENEFISLEDQFKTLCCINLNIGKENNIKKDKKRPRRKSSNINTDIIIRETSTRRSSKFVNLFINNDVNFEENNDNINNIDENEYDNNNYAFYCMKIINKGLIKNKNEFIDKETIDNLINPNIDNLDLG